MAAAGVAAMGGIGSGGEGELYGTLAKALDIYSVLLTLRVLLTWFRNISWSSEPFNTIKQFTDPFLSMFRGIIPPIGGIDLSIMLGFFLISFVSKMLKRMSFGMPPF
ncbi:hypothetical protein FOA52_013478 [Chlamydomonas sp. UWO 241]|nr:hypothetical protein FOA52_013478 [Chlamydomonas sp. UWO 241]